MRYFVWFLLMGCLIRCKDADEVRTVFHGSVTRESDSGPAVGVKLVFTGLDVGEGLWPTIEEISTHTSTVDASGQFHITIPENSKIDRFKLAAQSSAGSSVDIISGCPDWQCSHLQPNTTTELVIKVGL